MNSINWIRRYLARSLLIRRFATMVGLAPRARVAVAAAGRTGAKLTFQWRSIRWEKEGTVVIFPEMDPSTVQYRVLNMGPFLPRLIFAPEGKYRIADLRQPSKYLLPSGGTVWLPVPAEPVDFFAGYFAKGGPLTGQIVLDAGAYCGETTIEMAARVGPSGHVYAFEPDPKNLAWLRRNIEECGLKNITVVPQGLWGKTTTLEFFSDETPASTLVGINESVRSTGTVSRIEVLSPEDAFALIGRIPDFIKMDIEGAEVEVVEALAPLLGGARVKLAIASYHLRSRQKTCELITPILAKFGLAVETGYDEHLTTWAWCEN